MTLLVLIAAALIVSAFTMRYFISKPVSLKTDEELATAWNDFRTLHSSPEKMHTSPDVSQRTLFTFDPNTLDSLGFIKLGLRPHTTKLLLNWRRKGKVFYEKEEFKKLYTLSEEEYNTLAPYIVISQNHKENHAYSNEYRNNYIPPPDHVDINTVDSATLVRLRGIGPFFAHKLIERRDALGGYIKQEQFLEAYRFKDSIFDMLKERLIINPNSIRKIKINTAPEEQLKAHPYIGEKTAKNIILYRDAIKRFEKMEQLKQVPLMNEEIYRKIVPYLSTE